VSSPGRSAGRVTAGSAQGLRLAAPGPGTRPLTDRVKQSLFGTLAGMLPGARVLDLFAGSGAAGIEALSRGAAWCDFVESDANAAATIRANLRTTRVGDRASVHQSDVVRFLARTGEGGATDHGYDLAILDPPYGDAAMLAALEILGRGAVLTPEAIVVAKHFWRDAPPDRIGVLGKTRTKRFGETALTFYGRATDGPSSDDVTT
jgi:16S rRNA (guanine(966)-N(2))-methyltransferase RsmD